MIAGAREIQAKKKHISVDEEYLFSIKINLYVNIKFLEGMFRQKVKAWCKKTFGKVMDWSVQDGKFFH